MKRKKRNYLSHVPNVNSLTFQGPCVLMYSMWSTCTIVSAWCESSRSRLGSRLSGKVGDLKRKQNQFIPASRFSTAAYTVLNGCCCLATVSQCVLLMVSQISHQEEKEINIYIYIYSLQYQGVSINAHNTLP